jgi:hypothetical protein
MSPLSAASPPTLSRDVPTTSAIFGMLLPRHGGDRKGKKSSRQNCDLNDRYTKRQSFEDLKDPQIRRVRPQAVDGSRRRTSGPNGLARQADR